MTHPRLAEVATQCTGGPVYNMRIVLDHLSDSEVVPDSNKYYVFVYKAKTPNLQYDQHPLVLCGDVYPWGFTGYNFHWNETRRYSWGEILSNLYELNDEEFNIVKDIPIAYFRTS